MDWSMALANSFIRMVEGMRASGGKAEWRVLGSFTINQIASPTKENGSMINSQAGEFFTTSIHSLWLLLSTTVTSTTSKNTGSSMRVFLYLLRLVLLRHEARMGTAVPLKRRVLRRRVQERLRWWNGNFCDAEREGDKRSLAKQHYGVIFNYAVAINILIIH